MRPFKISKAGEIYLVLNYERGYSNDGVIAEGIYLVAIEKTKEIKGIPESKMKLYTYEGLA